MPEERSDHQAETGHRGLGKDTRTIDARAENALYEDLRMTSLQSMCTERFVEHLEPQAARLDTYDRCRTEVTRLLEIHESREAATGATPMEVMDAWTKGKGKTRTRVQRTAKGEEKAQQAKKRPSRSQENAESAGGTAIWHETTGGKKKVARIPRKSTA